MRHTPEGGALVELQVAPASAHPASHLVSVRVAVGATSDDGSDDVADTPPAPPLQGEPVPGSTQPAVSTDGGAAASSSVQGGGGSCNRNREPAGRQITLALPTPEAGCGGPGSAQKRCHYRLWKRHHGSRPKEYRQRSGQNPATCGVSGCGCTATTDHHRRGSPADAGAWGRAAPHPHAQAAGAGAGAGTSRCDTTAWAGGSAADKRHAR